jgi:hypothetical protein
MVQILPPKTDLGTALGSSLGRGLSSGLQQGSDIGFQRGLIQNALQGLQNLPANSSPLDATKYLLEATAGLPDQGRIMQALAPYLIGGARTNALYGGNQGNNGQVQENANLLKEQPGNISNPQGQQQNQQQQPQYGGYFQKVKTPEEINQFARKYQLAYPENPNAYLQGQQIAQSENANIEKSWNNFVSEAVTQNKSLQKFPDRIPLYKEILQKNSYLTDPNQITKKANEEFGVVNNLLDKFEEAEIPGFASGAVSKGLKAASHAGLVPSFLVPDEKRRQNALKGYSQSAQEIAKMGYEPYLRSRLTQQKLLSPTEIDTLFHPLSTKNVQSLSSLPASGKIPDSKQQGLLSNFFKNNIGDDTSLLALRQQLWNDKGYDWRRIGPAIRESGVQLNPRQEAEMVTINEAPLQSMSDIFRGWGRWIDYLRGAQ